MSKVITPKNAHLHPLRDMCVQYENNPENVFLRYRQETVLSSALN